jgi:hypothetical protein
MLNNSYIAGILDTNGSFYYYQNKHLYFKISIKNERIMSNVYTYLKNKLKINIRLYGKIYYITNEEGVEKIVRFMKKHCIRTDYEKIK